MTTRSSSLGPAGKAAVVLGGVLPAIAAGTISVMLPGISDAFDGAHHGLMVKMVATAVGLGMMFGAPLGGVLADRIGRRDVLVGAAAIFGLFGLSALLVTELWQLIAARFVIGLAAGALTAVAVALIGDHFEPAAQGRWLGLNGGVAVVIVVLLNPIAGALVDTGWRNGFLIYALALPIMLLVYLGVPPGRTHAPTDALALAAEELRKDKLSPVWKTVVLATFAGTLATGTVLYWPFRLRELGVESARDLALYYVPNIIVVAAAAFAYPLIRRRLSVTQVFAASGLLSAIGLCILALAPTPIVASLGLIIEGAGIGVMTPNLSLYAISIAPAQARARVIGMMKGVYFGSPFATQFLLEALNRAGGVPAALLGIATSSGMLGIYMVVQSRGERRGPTAVTAR